MWYYANVSPRRQSSGYRSLSQVSASSKAGLDTSNWNGTAAASVFLSRRCLCSGLRQRINGLILTRRISHILLSRVTSTLSWVTVIFKIISSKLSLKWPARDFCKTRTATRIYFLISGPSFIKKQLTARRVHPCFAHKHTLHAGFHRVITSTRTLIVSGVGGALGIYDSGHRVQSLHPQLQV